jgi:hypothetical protein
MMMILATFTIMALLMRMSTTEIKDLAEDEM